MKKNPTTVGGWLQTLPPAIKEKALKNADSGLLTERVNSLQDALSGAFVFSSTPEGHFFWADIAYRNKYPDEKDQ